MPGPCIAVEGGEIGNQSGPQRIEVDIANQFEEVGIFLADDGFVAVLKEMPGTVVTAIEIDGIACEKSAHEGGEPAMAGAEQQVNVVGHQRPGEAFDASLDEEFGQGLEKPAAVGIVPENVATVDTADDDVLEEVGDVESCGSWHEGRVTSFGN